MIKLIVDINGDAPMIIEILGQPASGKTFITKEVENQLKLAEMPVYVPEFIWGGKTKLQKAFIFSSWYVFNFGFLFNKGLKKALLIIKQNVQTKSKRYYIYRLLLAYYFIKKTKKYYKKRVVLFSENVINISAYVLRDNLKDSLLKAFTDLYTNVLGTDVSITYVYVWNDFQSVVEKKQERFTALNNEIKNYINDDVKSNILLFDTLSSLERIKSQTIKFKNSYDTGSKTKIKDLCRIIISKFKNTSI